MANWFFTGYAILDYDQCSYFWIEDIPDGSHVVFTKTKDDIEWRIREFKEEKEATEFLSEIFSILARINKT